MQLNFGDVEVSPLPLPAQWRIRQVVLRGPEGEDKFFTMMTVFTAAGVHVSFWEDDSLVELGHQAVRLGKLNKKGVRDTDPGPEVTGAQKG